MFCILLFYVGLSLCGLVRAQAEISSHSKHASRIGKAMAGKASKAMKAMKVAAIMKKPAAKNAKRAKKPSTSKVDPLAARFEKDLDEAYADYQDLKSHNASFGEPAGVQWRRCHVHVTVCLCMCFPLQLQRRVYQWLWRKTPKAMAMSQDKISLRTRRRPVAGSERSEAGRHIGNGVEFDDPILTLSCHCPPDWFQSDSRLPPTRALGVVQKVFSGM